MRITSSEACKPQATFNKTRLCLLIAAMLSPGLSHASPVVGSGGVTSGSATIVQTGNVTNVNQSSNKATINWWSFSTGPSDVVNFNQPNSSSMTLNRVIGNEKSVLQGVINAPGHVFLINTNGVLFTKGASVNTGGFVASTLNLTDADFNAGNYVFRANGSAGSVINMGTITAKNGGYVALIGNSVSNQGVITATKGTVSLNSGDKITLNFNGNSLVSVSIDEGTLNGLVENKQAIYADGGQVIMTAKAADDLLGAQVNNGGLIQARTVDDLKGHIELNAHGGTTNVTGTLDASAPSGGDGGFIETSGEKVKIADGSIITTKSNGGKSGSWLVDPDGYTIGAGGDISGAQLSQNLANNGLVTVQSTNGSGSDGNINVNETVSWSTDSSLSLQATNNININAPITATGTNSGLSLSYGVNGNYAINTANNASVTLSGSNATLNIQSNAYTLIHDMAGLSGIGTGNYALAGNLDAAGTTYTNPVVGSLTGTFAGLGHTISNLTMANTSGGLGLINTINAGSTVRDIGLVNAQISGTTLAEQGGQNIGTLAQSNQGNISNAYATGAVTGYSTVGGLVGTNSGTISNSYTNVAITGASIDNPTTHAAPSNIGGLAGSNSGTISNSHANGAVIGGAATGGLVGNNSGSIFNSYATGAVRGIGNGTSTGPADAVGGLVGLNTVALQPRQGIIDNSYATGAVTGDDLVGGLVGSSVTSGTFTPPRITNSHATGAVTATGAFGAAGAGSAGGLIGANNGSVDNSYATGDVSSTNSAGGYAGGLIGYNQGKGVVTNSQAYGKVSAAGGNFVGGFVGRNFGGTISGSTASGDVTSSTGTGVGGFAGANTGTITTSSATGNVIGGEDVGGFVGLNTGTVNTVTATGDFRGTGVNVGGISGLNSGAGKALNSSYKSASAARAAAVQQARGVDATQRSGNIVDTAQLPAADLMPTSSFANSAPTTDSHIVFADSNGFSANVKSVTINGVEYNVEDSDAEKSKSDNNK